MANYELDATFTTELRKLDPKEPNHADTAFNPHFKQLVNNDQRLKEDIEDVRDNPLFSIAGNSATATKLQTARAINGVSFDGTKDITITAAANGGNAATVGGYSVSTLLSSIPTSGSVTVSGSTQAAISPATNTIGNNLSTSTGMGAGTYTIQSVIQGLVTRSHTHARINYNCNCDCGGGCP